MEKFTLRSTYTEVSLYARWTASASGGKPAEARAPAQADDTGVPAGNLASEKAVTARNADGDTFTLSLEARAIQVSESITIETRGGCGRPAEAAGPSRASRLQALMDALDRRHAHGDRPHRYPRLADAEDVAARAAEDWDRDFAARPGSRRDFAAALRAKLDRWAAGGSDLRHVSMEHREFRSEVAVRISARLENWAASENAEAVAAPDDPSSPSAAPDDPPIPGLPSALDGPAAA